MSIQFKFRSSVNFETLDIENRPSISVGELRARILRGKFSQQQQGFDLVFSDALSGIEYKGDDSLIPRGSSVIVKRVPGGTQPLPPSAVPSIQAVKDVERKEFGNLCTPSGPKDELDILGVDPMPESNFLDFNFASDKDNFEGNENDGICGSRLGCQKLNSCKSNQEILQGSNQCQNVRNVLPKVDEQKELKKLSPPNALDAQNNNLPLELKCTLCNTFFKDAVMIPCCQHSFCEKCIRQVLIDRRICPKCSSNKCTVENLLPNLSLRQAIEHFLESQMVNNNSENAMQKYVPDGESGIQVQDVSCAITVVQRELELPQSSCATGRGSNQVFMEGLYGHQHGRNVPYANFDIQAENQNTFSQANVPDEADSNTRRRGGIRNDSSGGDRNFSGFGGGYRKGTRNCYTCGSPDHLMRDCPLANQNTMFRPDNGAFHGGMPGYAPPYWNGSSMPPFRPYANMYNNSGMVPFNASMVPVSPFAAAPYIPSMPGGLPGVGGNMRMGNMGPPRASELFGLEPCENIRKPPNEDLGRDQREQLSANNEGSPECGHRNGPEKSVDHKLWKDRESSLSYSGEVFGRKGQHDKHMHSDDHYVDGRHDKGSHSSFAGKDKRPSHAERSSSGKDDLVRSSDRHSDGRHKQQHYHGEQKKSNEKRGHSGSELSLGHYSTQKEVRRRVESDVRSSHQKHHSFRESGPEARSPTERRGGGHKERDSSHDSRHSRHGLKHGREEQHDDKWRISGGHEDERRDEHRYHRRRAH
ncbi:E3 ubiquitin ligase PARAQUAT TOLERANCE 3-like [Andrographis paniculata]|uniref:E3 ubiquitin ligase PARAQUAT TOLERANCE 3-like n=1 Tax=Andrographis paniculata TaxID=175694 RepID=UPI0021E98643|nr:E3 ubiquitin ligase PARAQUAT TOLERANCE 3-like [Andrographis paniculata]